MKSFVNTMMIAALVFLWLMVITGWAILVSELRVLSTDRWLVVLMLSSILSLVALGWTALCIELWSRREGK